MGSARLGCTTRVCLTLVGAPMIDNEFPVSFFNSELGWHQTKVDDLLLPIIRKMGKRGQVDSRFLFLFSLLN